MTRKARAALAIVLGLFFLTQIFAISAYFVGIDGITGWWGYIYVTLLLLGTILCASAILWVVIQVMKWVDRGK